MFLGFWWIFGCRGTLVFVVLVAFVLVFLAIGCCVAYCGVFVQLLRGVLFVSLGCVVCNVLVGCVSVRR